MGVHTLLIGLDGATFSILDPLIQDGIMPFLSGFVRSGARADLRSVVPALTPPAWTSLITGRSPGEHGVFDFFQKKTACSRSLQFTTSRDVKSPTVWSMANEAGLRVAALNFPLTFPPPVIDGYVVPGWMPWRQLRLGCRPPELFDRLKARPGFNPRELAMDMRLEERALEGCGQDEFESWIALHSQREEQWYQIAADMLAEEHPCEFVSMVFDGVDKLQHLCWRYLDPKLAQTLDQPWELRVRESCLNYFRRLDGLLARLVQAAGPESNVFIVSDHGFGPQQRTFFVNAWLQRQGYLAWANDDAPRANSGQQLGVGQIARHEYLLDWTRTIAYAPLPSGNGIHFVREAACVKQPADYEQMRDRMIAELLAIREPHTGTCVVQQAWKREEIHSGPYVELAPDLTLVLEDGGLISILAAEEPVGLRQEPSGAHRPLGIFAARGPAWRIGVNLPELSILDVAPMLLYGLGLSIPTALEGRLPTELVDPMHLRRHPPTYRGDLVLPGMRSAEKDGPNLDEAAEIEIVKRLRALGYMD